MTPAQDQPAAPTAAPAAINPPLPVAEPGSLLELVLQSLDDDQAQDVVAIPLAGKSEIADYMIVASGRSNRQVAAIAEKLASEVSSGRCVFFDFGQRPAIYK